MREKRKRKKRKRKQKRKTYHSVGISEPHKNPALARVLPKQAGAVELAGDEVGEDVLAAGVKGPVDLAPRDSGARVR